MAKDNKWNYQSVPEFYDRVRAALDGLSDVSLPDKYIDLPEKAPYAELFVKAKVPGWATLSETDFALFESAIVYKTASMFESLAMSGATKKKELPTITIEYFAKQAVQVNGLSLSDLADLLIGELSGESEQYPVMFMVTQ